MQYRNSSYSSGVWDTYYYEKNLQGDIIAVYSAAGTKLVTYIYDAWGALLNTTYSNGGASTAAAYNPLKYRGYYYDDDLDLYYLATRYYDPEVCRFITADSYVSTGQGILGHNRYAYCSNNPVVRVDLSGEFWDSIANWFRNTFGAGVIQSQSYEAINILTVFAGYETGIGTTKVAAGDVSKPISFYVTSASDWWDIWAYKLGVQFNENDSGLSFSFGLGGFDLTFADEGTAVELNCGLDKLGITIYNDVEFGNRTAGTYEHVYIRTIPTALAIIGACYLNMYVPIPIPI